MAVRLSIPCLVVLVGPAGAGKSTWAAANFAHEQVVSSDRLRATVGYGEDDQAASADAFELLDLIVERRLRRGLTTVIDSTALDDERRQGYVATARRHGVPCHVVAFDVTPGVAHERNRSRDRPIPQKALENQLRRWRKVRARLVEDGFDTVNPPEPVALVPPELLETPRFAHQQKEHPMSLQFDLQIPSFTWPGGPAEMAERLSEIAGRAEEIGFGGIWVMDHLRQIPQVGPEWHDMLDCYTALGFLAGKTSRVRLGVLVTGIMYRNPAHLGKIVATLDVLSGGRAMCGLGIGWFEKEHLAYGWDFPPVADRYAVLEETLEMLQALWGPGSPSYEGRVLKVPEAMCYPRPLKERVPILIGGSGEKKTLRLVARHADACNLFGDPETVAQKLEVLRGHCESEGRSFDEIEVTNLTSALVARDRGVLTEKVDALRPKNQSADQYAALVGAGTVEDQVGRYRRYAEAGVETAIVNLPDLSNPDQLELFGEVIWAFR